jgi:hypothetical protein
MMMKTILGMRKQAKALSFCLMQKCLFWEGTYVWFDVFAAAYFERNIASRTTYPYWKEPVRVIRLSQLGCTDYRASQSSRSIKNSTLLSMSLSVVELASELKDHIASKMPNDHEEANQSQSFVPRGDDHITTTTFACSALVYLHVVIPGAYPEVPEIRHYVNSSMMCLKELTLPILCFP